MGEVLEKQAGRLRR